ncbi:MAG: epimerase [Deltaproteobacteria bacterium]|nr:epimerase [Deltaproteobacteria bacterium]
MRVAVFGGTGTAGAGALEACLAEPQVERVLAFTRRPLPLADPRLEPVHVDDFLHLGPVEDAFDGLDAVLWCLGVSANKVRKEDDYRRITETFTLVAAHVLARRSPTAVFHFLSGQATNPRSRFMWARVKGDAELALRALDPPLGGVVCWRPGYIHPREPGAVMRAIYPAFRLIPGASVRATELGRAMVRATLDGLREGTLENRAIRRLAAAAP